MNHPENEAEKPLHALNKKALRQLARKHKIRHYYRKSPASLRRALRRKQKQTLEPVLNQARKQIASQTPVRSEAPLSREQARVKAYEEHRLRYLFAPSQFVHKGTHEEYILEKDDEIDLPDFYREDELVALPIDPHRFYVYWDFAEETLYDVRSWLAEDDPFVLRIHDVSQLVFDGSNAHQTWEEPCHPLIREWYLNAPVSGADLCVELGVRLADGFRLILRSNPIFVPPASVSPVKQDIFAAFVPALPRETDLAPAPQAVLPPPEAPPVHQPAAKPETSAHLFFQEYVPTPVKYHPVPPPRDTRWPEPLPAAFFAPVDRPLQQAPQDFRQPEPLAPGPQLPQMLSLPEADAQPEWVLEAASPAPPLEAPLLEQHLLSPAGQETLQHWLGVPHAIRWLSDLPVGLSPIFYEQWIADPYDRAVMISYAIWPWEFTEYLPLGASDQTLRKFLGASLFSWYTPGGSERMRWWQRPGGASEQVYWLRPEGASERAWSGLMQQQAASSPGRSVWSLWPRSASGQGV